MFSAANFVTGSGATQELVVVFNNSDGNKFTGSFVDKDGHTWEVEVNVTFKLATAVDFERVTNASVEQRAENFLNISLPSEADRGRSFAGEKGPKYYRNANASIYGNDTADECGNPIPISASVGNLSYLYKDLSDFAYVAIHETLHLYGLGDRYTDNVTYQFVNLNGELTRTIPYTFSQIGFSNDVMGKQGSFGFSQAHIDNLANTALPVSPLEGVGKFNMARYADKANNADVGAVEKSMEDGKYTNPEKKK